MRLALLALWLSAATGAQADDTVCGGQAGLARFSGIWTHVTVLQQLASTRSWQAGILGHEQHATLYVSPPRADFNLAWHEGDVGTACVRQDSAGLWARSAQETTWQGPYQRSRATTHDDEAAAYLAVYFKGCFRSDAGERWCLTPQGFSIDGRAVAARLQMDLSEGPLYGTAFATTLSPRPFTVFVPRSDGWDVFQDDWASSPDRHPIDTAKDRPWRRLKAE